MTDAEGDSSPVGPLGAPEVTGCRGTAVLLLSHGSRDPRAHYVVDQLVAAVAARTGRTVRPAHLDFTPPTAALALQHLAADGFTTVRVVPLLFTPGYHLTHDVPAAIAASGITTRVNVSVAPALLAGGPRARGLLLAALAERLTQAGAEGQVDALVLASAGSKTEASRQHVAVLVHDLAQAHGIPVVPAFASIAASPTQALELLADRGFERPAVASLFVAPGKLLDSVVARFANLAVADPLGVSPAFVELLVMQALSGQDHPCPGGGNLGWPSPTSYIR